MVLHPRARARACLLENGCCCPLSCCRCRCALQGYDYSDSAPSLLVQATQPPLAYVAPELIACGAPVTVAPAADVFSLAALSYEMLARQGQLLPVQNSLTGAPDGSAHTAPPVRARKRAPLEGHAVGVRREQRQPSSQG